MRLRRTRRKSLATIHAIGKAFGYSSLDLRFIARRTVAEDLAEDEGLSALSDEELDSLATIMVQHSMMMDIYIATGGFRDRFRQAIQNARSITAVTKKKESDGAVSMEQRLTDFASIVNKEVCKDLPPNSDLSNPKMLFGNLPDSEVIRSGMMPMDIALGVGGLTRGTFNVIVGEKGSSKTGTALNFCAWASNKANMPVFYFDSEAAVTSKMLRSAGLDSDKMLISNTSKLDVLAAMLRRINREFTDAFIVIDSMPSYLAPSSYNKSDINESSRLGAEAAMWNEMLGTLIDDLAASNNTVLAVNQLRANMNRGNPHAPTHVPWGTTRLEYAATTYIKTRRPKLHYGKDSVTGQERVTSMDLKFTLEKNKTAFHGVRFEVPVNTATGINHEAAAIDYAKQVPDEENFMMLPSKRYDPQKGIVNSNSKFCAFPLHEEEVVDMLARRGVELDPEDAFYVWKKDEWGVELEDWLREDPDFTYWVQQRVLDYILTKQGLELAGGDETLLAKSDPADE